MIRLVKLETIDGVRFVNPFWVEEVCWLETTPQGPVTEVRMRGTYIGGSRYRLAQSIDEVVALLAASVTSAKGLFG